MTVAAQVVKATRVHLDPLAPLVLLAPPDILVTKDQEYVQALT